MSDRKKTSARGALRVLSSNPVYFSADGRTPVVLAGPHTWANLQDFGGDAVFKFAAYLDLLTDLGLNFIRLWTWPGPMDNEMLGLDPYPWLRSGTGSANDGGTLFDLGRFNDAFFCRLRDRASRADERGIYLSVMLFQWHSLTAEAWPLNPFNPQNNVNGFPSDLNPEQTISADAPAPVMAAEEAYVRRCVETLNGLDNIVWEIGNEIPREGLAWEKRQVCFIRSCERELAKRHLVGVNTGTGPDPPEAALHELIGTGADFVSFPSPDKDNYEPPAASQLGLPVLADSDHISHALNTRTPAVKVDWAWKSFTRGLHPLDMEALQVPLPLPSGSRSEPWNDLSNPAFPAARQVMATILHLSRHLPLATMAPQTDGYALVSADPAEPFWVVYQHEPGADLTLDLAAVSGTLWYQMLPNPKTGKATPPRSIEGGNPEQEFPAPGDGPWVLVLSRRATPVPPSGG